LFFALERAGKSIAAKMAMMAITTNNSIKVNPLGVFDGIKLFFMFGTVGVSILHGLVQLFMNSAFTLLADVLIASISTDVIVKIKKNFELFRHPSHGSPVDWRKLSLACPKSNPNSTHPRRTGWCKGVSRTEIFGGPPTAAGWSGACTTRFNTPG
jgi:hypothetical protein